MFWDKAAQYARQMDQAAIAFVAAGHSLSPTMGDGIDFFYEQPGINPDHFEDKRGVFHEAMHVLANCLDGSTASERDASVYERVLMRGGWSNENKDDIALFGTPKPAMSFKDSECATKFRSDLINAFRMNPDPAYHGVEPGSTKQLYDRAIEDDLFFRKVTGGRALYQLTAAELLAMPLCFMGVTVDRTQGFAVTRMSDKARQSVLWSLGIDWSGFTASSASPAYDVTNRSDFMPQPARPPSINFL